MRSRWTLAGAALAVVLAGCSAVPDQGDPTVATTPSPLPATTTASPPTPAASPTAAPEPEPEPEWIPPDPEDWKLVHDAGFDQPTMPKLWGYSLTGIYDAGGRWCSAPVKANVGFGDSVVRLATSRASKKVTTKVNATARRKQAKAGQKVIGCPEGVFDNAMITTEGRFGLATGMVAARVRFPAEQGAHAAVWLYDRTGQEIDIFESYGYGRGVTNIVHLRGRKTPAAGPDGYVVPELVADRAWWDRWHVVAVEWTSSKVVFSLDGEVTRTLKVKVPKGEYALMLSMLSSDWETYRLTKPHLRPGAGVDPASMEVPELPFAMEVDWVRAWKRR